MIKFNIIEERNKTGVRIGELKVNGKRVKTPCFWLGVEIGAKPNPLEYLKVDAIMVNAYKALKKRLNCPIHQVLKTRAVIMMDSGGFQQMKNQNLQIEPEDVLNLYKETKPDIGVVLDHPLNPQDVENRMQKWKKTLENTQFMLKNSGDIVLMPVVHGYTLEELKKACRDIKKIADPKIVGIGSLVPLIKNVGLEKFRKINGMKPLEFVSKAISVVREEFPDALLHVFGVGSVVTMHLMFGLGVDSVDSMAWRLKASYGAIQLPGVGDRFISPVNGRKKLSEESLLEACSCPICSGKTLYERKNELDNSNPKTFNNRAIHNAFVFIEEFKSFRKSLEGGTVETFLINRLKATRYFKILRFS